MCSFRVKKLRCYGQIQIARHFEPTPTQQAIRGASFVHCESSVHRNSGKQCSNEFMRQYAIYLGPDRAEGREGNNRHFALKFFERISLSLRLFLEILLRFDSENGKPSSSR